MLKRAMDARHSPISVCPATSQSTTMNRMPSPSKDHRVSLTVRVRRDVAEEARRVARFEAGHPRFLRLNLLVELALIAYLDELKSEGGKLHPSRNHNPVRSRP
jgi:hypothetical protein